MAKGVRTVVVLLLTVILVSCTWTRSISDNADAVVRIKHLNGSQMVGTSVYCQQDKCLILTAAHGCDPDVSRRIVKEDLTHGAINVEEAIDELTKLDDIIKNGTFCDAQVTHGDITAYGKAVVVDFDRDLLILYARFTKALSPVKLTNEKLKEDQDIYTIVMPSDFYNPVVLFSHVGLRLSPVISGTTQRRHFIQTEFSVGPGASGSPIFTKEGLMVAIIHAQLTEGMLKAPIHATYITREGEIIEFMKSVKLFLKENHDSQSNWPHCIGKEYLCKLVRDAKSMLEVYGCSEGEGCQSLPEP